MKYWCKSEPGERNDLHVLRVLSRVLVFACLFGFSQSAQSVEQPSAGPGIAEKFSQPGAEADFQKHVAPLLGRLGCNARACHGSFQGQGGFQLSLFGYDFEADHQALS